MAHQYSIISHVRLDSLTAQQRTWYFGPTRGLIHLPLSITLAENTKTVHVLELVLVLVGQLGTLGTASIMGISLATAPPKWPGPVGFSQKHANNGVE